MTIASRIVHSLAIGVPLLQAACYEGPKEARAGSAESLSAIPVEGLFHFEFGQALEGTRLTHTFVLESTASPFAIKSLTSDCACTVATPRLRSKSGALTPYAFGINVPSGDEVLIDATLATKGKKGPLLQSIFVNTESHPTPLKLSLAADVIPLAIVDPQPLDLGTFSTNESRAGVIYITSPLGPLNVSLGGRQLPSGVHLELQPASEEEDGFAPIWTLSAAVGPDAEISSSHFYAVNLDCLWPPTIVLPTESSVAGNSPYQVAATIVAKVTGAVSVMPEYLSFGRISFNAKSERSVRLQATDGSTLTLALESIKVTAEGISPEHVKVRLVPVDASSYDIVLECKPSPNDSLVFRGEVAIPQHSIAVPYFGLIAKE